MMNAYLVTIAIKHPNDPNQLVNNFFVVAQDDTTAKQRGREQLAEAVLRTKIQGFKVVGESIQPIGQEFIEEAAIEVLGWKPPA